MNKSFATIASAAAALGFSLGALAQTTAPAAQDPGTTTTTTTTTQETIIVPAPTLNRTDAGDLKNQSEAQYKARKKIADANLDLNKADCVSTSEGAVKRACKADAKAQAKKDKTAAKVIHTQEKSDINAITQ